MAQTTPELRRIIQQYRSQLKKMGISVEQILLYGSQAADSAQEGSDIDLIVISDDWEPLSTRLRLEILGVAAARILEPIQAQGFTRKEISQGKLSAFWDHIIQNQAVAV